VFESEFLTPTEESKSRYRHLIAQAAQIVCTSLPDQPYCGKTAAALAELVDSDFLPAVGDSSAEIAETLRTVVSNSIAVSHPHTAAHLHCPPLLAALAAEVVISALNQSMDSFDQAPIATVVEQKLIRWLCAEAGLPATADGTFTTGGSQSNYMGLLLARDTICRRQWNWSVQKSGLPPEARRLRIFCSEVAHFAVGEIGVAAGTGNRLGRARRGGWSIPHGSRGTARCARGGSSPKPVSHGDCGHGRHHRLRLARSLA
jgi:L-2,4-diaminobutyrate decarboxylase